MNQYNRYLRQMILPNFDITGQRKLQQAKVLVIGCGGLGAPVVQYLAAAGVGEITLCDDDRIEITNLNRQTLFSTDDIGKFKVTQTAKFASDLNPLIKVNIKDERISCHNIRQVIRGHHCIIDCTDGLPSKFLINDAAVLENCTLIHGSAISYQGRFMVINEESACLRCFFPEKPNVAEMPTCRTLGILGPVCGVIGSFMAIETIKLLIGDEISTNKYTLVNCSPTIQIKQFEVQKDPNCPVCGEHRTTKQLQAQDYNFTCSI